jgi:hypothetical protein
MALVISSSSSSPSFSEEESVEPALDSHSSPSLTIAVMYIP